MRMGLKSDFGMVASLAFLGIVGSLSIDNQLTLVKNDCYERLAIGQRLNPTTVYKTLELNTLKECEMACTEQNSACRTFSFGIGTTGNGTCELSADTVKETADLKPIGTVADTDYDLYVKKRGCSVVVEKQPHDKPLPGDTKPDAGLEHGQVSTSGDKRVPPPRPPYASNFDSQYYLPPGKDEIYHVKSLVSVASGPKTYLHPIHDILVGEDPYEYGKRYGIKYWESNGRPSGGCCEKPAKSCCKDKYIPPFRPSVLNNPYDDGRFPFGPDDNAPDSYHDPRRGDYRPYSGHREPRPSKGPNFDRYDDFNPDRLDKPYGPDFRPDTDKYDDFEHGRPNRIPNRPYRPDIDHDKPNRLPDRPYGADFDRDRPNRVPDRPYGTGFDHDRPNRIPDRPYGPDFDRDRPNQIPDRPYGPNFDHDKPNRIPDRPYGPDFDHDRPNRIPDRPYDSDFDQNKPNRIPDRPYGPKFDHDRPNRIPDRPYGPDFDHDRPNHIPDRPYGPNFDHDKPNRIPDRPYGPGLDHKRPDQVPDRPYGPNFRPEADKYDDFNPNKPNTDRYDDDRPPRRPFRPEAQDYGPGPQFGSHVRPLPPRPSESNGYGPTPPKRPGYDGPNGQDGGYHYPEPDKPYDTAKPHPDSQKPSGSSGDGYENRPAGPQRPPGDRPLDPDNPNGGYVYDKPPAGNQLSNGGYAYDKPAGGNQLSHGGENGGSGVKVSHSVGPHGVQITSIITELNETCFRRVLAGKRVARRCVRRTLTCETAEACQRECADEKYFICEGFNYRIDPTGRGKGECELLDVPLSRLDISRDLYPDPDYDYYERDRNAASARCRQWPTRGYSPYPTYPIDVYDRRRGEGPYPNRRGSFGYYPNSDIDRRYDGPYRPDSKGDRRPSDTSLRRPADRWSEDEYDRRRPRPEADRRVDGYRPISGGRRGDYSYHHPHPYHDYENSRHYYNGPDDFERRGDRRNPGIHYLPAHYYHIPYYQYDSKSYEPYLPPQRFSEKPYGFDKPPHGEKGRYPWGSDRNSYATFGYANSYNWYDSQYHNRNRYDFDRRNYYLPPKTGTLKDWGLYGGTYGNGGGYYQNGYGNQHSYNYYGLNKYDDGFDNYLPSSKPSYLPLPRPPSGSYLPKPFTNEGYLPSLPKPGIYDGHGGGPIPSNHIDNNVLPAEPRRPFRYDFIKDECSLRSASGFRLHKGIVKKFYAVPNIYECELLCYKESDFPCQSYAYRYTSSPAPTYNCYLSNKDYKGLDHYTDLEPDRDFDIYTMNNRDRCEAPLIPRKDYSECFWRVRSGQRLDQRVVRDSLTTKSIVDCQIECLHATRFTCRAYSFRYGSPIIGGVIDNCQLTDCPFYELDPRLDFVPEPGFEVYERGSYGHGCEPDHFGIRGKPTKDPGLKADQLCYIGFGSPARLLPQAAKKALFVGTELECKAECSKLREGTLLQCMSFSYRTNGPKSLPNCLLSDILQRDLLPNVDFVYDTNSWLFAWDNYSPQCTALAYQPVHGSYPEKGGGISNRHDWDIFHSLDTWRVYSVSGWPCRRGSLCVENREAGFWYCELEGGDKNTWDYCCRPDHQCGASRGYPYQWCYVGPEKTQWRKCSDRYYPYVHNIIHSKDPSNHYLPPAQNKPWTLPPYRPGARPDRLPAPPLEPPPRPSLDDYEKLFENEFLDPPKPGGFGQARHWPVSYLHQEMPPNTTDADAEPRLMKMQKEENPKYAAIRNLIDVIRNNDLKNVQYHISNDSNKPDDILFVRIPLPTNFTQESKPPGVNKLSSNTSISLEPVYFDEGSQVHTKRSQKSLHLTTIKVSPVNKESHHEHSDISRPSPVYRRGFVTRTNVTHRW